MTKDRLTITFDHTIGKHSGKDIPCLTIARPHDNGYIDIIKCIHGERAVWLYENLVKEIESEGVKPSVLKCCDDCRYHETDKDGNSYCSIGKGPVWNEERNRQICIWWRWKEIANDNQRS